MKLALQPCSCLVRSFGMEKCYETIAATGFTGIIWQFEHALSADTIRSLQYQGSCVFEKPLEDVIAYYAEELSYIRKHGLALSQAHAPYPSYVSQHPEVAEYMIDIYRRCIELCEYAGCKYLVIHGTSMLHSADGNTPEASRALNMHLFESLIPTLNKCRNVTVCLENLCLWVGRAVEGFCSDSHEAVAYIDALNEKAGHEAFGFCLDTGHLMLARKDFRSYIPVLGKRIKTIHLHDNDGYTDNHMTPGTGVVNWTAFCEVLSHIGYDGDLCFETYNQLTKAQSIDQDLLIPWMQLICKTSEIFRKKILNL